MSLYDWVVLLVLIFGGAALLAKVLLVGDYRDDKEDKGGYRSRKSQRRQSDASKSRSYSSAAIDVEAELEAMIIRKTPKPVMTFEGKDAPLTNIQTMPAVRGTTRSPEVIRIPPMESPPRKEEYTTTFWEKIKSQSSVGYLRVLAGRPSISSIPREHGSGLAALQNYENGSGSKWTLMSQGAQQLGLNVRELSLDEERMAENLEAGHPIICILGPGDFTDSGHFIVLTGYRDGGLLYSLKSISKSISFFKG